VPDLQAAAAQDRPESGRNHPWGAAMITIPLEILEKIQSHRPHLGAMIGSLKAATSPELARKRRARAEAPARLPNKDNHG
jgi:hypothetical protein